MDDNMKRFITPGKLKQVIGTILAPENAGLRIILNFCSQDGKFDSAMEQLLAKKWMKAKSGYKEWFASQQNFKPGMFNSVAVASDVWVVHLLVKNKEAKLDDKILPAAIKKFAEFAKYERASVHIPAEALDEIPVLGALLKEHLVDAGIHTYIYFEQNRFKQT